MAKSELDKTSSAARAVKAIRLQREEDRRRWQAQAERMAARGRAIDAEQRPAGTPLLARSGRVVVHVGGALAKQPTKAGAVLEARHTRERGRGITYERKAVLCGKKGCAKLHGPYWYAFWTAGGRVRSVYIGKTFKRVEEKCPERLRTPE